MTPTEHACRAYLLGELPPADAQRLEEHLLENEEVFAAVRQAESELFDDWARGRLSAAEGERFLERFGGEHDRLSFARALAARAGAGRPAASARRRFWMPLAAAAGLLVAVGLAWQLRAKPPVTASAAGGADTRTAAPMRTVPPPVVLALTLGGSRAAAADAAQARELPRDVEVVQLRIRLHPADRFDRYRATLRATDDRVVWSADDLRVLEEAGELQLVADVPSSALASGSYELAVRGGDSDLGFVTVRLTKTP